MVFYRKVLVEEFTGAQCTNCPLGHRRLAELGNVFGDSIVVVSIHAGEFARPDSRKGYPNDFRTPDGEELNSRFRVFAYPAAVINRTKFDGSSYVVGVQNWGSIIATQLQTSTPLALYTRAVYDQAQDRITLTVQCRATAQITYPLNIGYYILEDSVVAPQLDNGTYVEAYIHRHMLRAAPLGPYGEKLSEALQLNTLIQRQYNFSLSGIEWKRNHLEVVVFVARPEPDYTIIQCDSKHVGPTQ